MNKHEPMNSSIALIAVMAIGLVVFAFKLHSVYEEKARVEADLNYYKKTYLHKQGGTSLWPGSKGEWLSYELQSFDSGRNWFVIRQDGDNTFVQGNVENVYPGLMKNLKAWDAIVERAEKNGPLKLENVMDLEALKAAGFLVVPRGTN